MTTPETPAPVPHIDPPEPAHPDEQDTITPGWTDESNSVPVQPEPTATEADGAATNVATEESSG